MLAAEKCPEQALPAFWAMNYGMAFLPRFLEGDRA